MRWSLMIDVYNHFDRDVVAGVLEGEVDGGVEVPHVETPGGKVFLFHQLHCGL